MARYKHKDLIIQTLGISYSEFEKRREDGDPEFGLWAAIYTAMPANIFEFLHIVEDFTGWEIESAEDFTLSAWKAYCKITGTKLFP